MEPPPRLSTRFRTTLKGASGTVILAVVLSAAAFGPGQDPGRTATGAVDLAAVLDRATDYCRRLEAAALDFVCREDIVETIDPTLDVKSPGMALTSWGSPDNRMPVTTITIVRKSKRTLLYDYQCVRKGGHLMERRTLLREDGRRRNEPDAPLKTRVVTFETPLLGPIGLFGERVRPLFDYRIAAREQFRRTPVVVVEAVPKPGAPPAKALFGKAWIDPLAGDIVRIEWNPNRIGHSEDFEKRGEKYKLEPRLTLTSEFETAKNGLRFPTRFAVEEAYRSERGRVFVRSTTVVTYDDFQFFTVEVDVRD